MIMTVQPLVGILCSAGPLELDWPELDFARRLVLLAQERGMVAFLTTPRDLDFADCSATGYIIKSEAENTWYMDRFPFPQVIYNRVGTLLEAEAKEKYSHLFAEFLPSEDKMQIFNHAGLNKWNVHQMLTAVSGLKVNIPATEHFSLEILAEFLNQFCRVYVKPQGASHGQGIIRLTKWPDAYFCELHTDFGKRRSQLYDDLSQITGLLLPNVDYLVQQGVQLASINGRIVDFRVHVIKNGQAAWEAVAAVGRCAPRQGVMTHGWCGGSYVLAQGLLEQLFPNQASTYFSGLNQAALAIARCLDSQLPGALAELGLDLGLDREGQPWLLEVNERPNRILLRLVDRQAEERLAALLLDYCTYLAAAKAAPLPGK